MKSKLTYEINNDNPEERKRFLRNLFDSIVPTYDLLNHVLSFGTDVMWRKDLIKRAGPPPNSLVIDLCCGTGDVSRVLSQCGAKTVSLDFSREMLQRGIKKKALAGDAVMGDACALPFQNDVFDTATIAFGIRNIPDLDHFMQETFRILKPNGTLAILELTRPENRIIRVLHSAHLRTVLPFIGGIMSGKPIAYRYLSGTITTFVHPHEIEEMLTNHGFGSISHYPKTLGVATIIVCQKEPR